MAAAGDDTITINDRGEGPLVIYGDTSEDGVRYSNDQAASSIHGTSFDNPGIDTINASQMLAKNDNYVGIVIFGGLGDDIINGSQDDDHLAGGSGGDTIPRRSRATIISTATEPSISTCCCSRRTKSLH